MISETFVQNVLITQYQAVPIITKTKHHYKMQHRSQTNKHNFNTNERSPTFSWKSILTYTYESKRTNKFQYLPSSKDSRCLLGKYCISQSTQFYQLLKSFPRICSLVKTINMKRILKSILWRMVTVEQNTFCYHPSLHAGAARANNGTLNLTEIR